MINQKIIKKAIILALIISLLILSSCQKKDTILSPTEIDRMIKQLYSGKGGLELNFMPNAPPEEVMEQQEIQLIFDLENIGAFNITNGYFGIGTEKDYVIFNNGTYAKTPITKDKLVPFSLAGKTLYEKKGQEETAILRFQTKKLENLSFYHDVKFRVTACYDYSTYLVADICVNLDSADSTKVTKGVCEFQPLKFSGQGAPIGVSLIDVRILPWDTTYRPEFYIELTNYAEGTVLNIYDIQKACSNQPINRSTINIVHFNGTFMGKPLICSPQDILIKDNIGKTRCWTERFQENELASRRSFLSPLIVKFDYGYTQTWTTGTRITKIPS